MEIIRCSDIGGKCEQKLLAKSWIDMVSVMAKHVSENHSDFAPTIEKRHIKTPRSK